MSRLSIREYIFLSTKYLVCCLELVEIRHLSKINRECITYVEFLEDIGNSHIPVEGRIFR